MIQKFMLAVPWRKEKPSSTAIGWMALITCIFAASTYNTFAKQLTGSLSPLSLFFVSEFLTGFFVLLSYGGMPVVSDLFRLRKSARLPLFIVGLTNGTLAPLLLFPGLRLSGAVNASIFGNLEQFFLVILAVTFLKEAFHREHGLCMIATVIGMLTISLRGFTDGMQLHFGDVLLVLSSVSYAIGGIIFRRYLHDIPPHLVLFARATTAVSFFFLLSPFLHHTLVEELQVFPWTLIPILLGFGFISRFLNVFTFYEALDHLPVTTVSILMNLNVIPSIIFAHMVLREPIETYHLLGGALIVSGGLLLEFAGAHKNKDLLENHMRSSQ